MPRIHIVTDSGATFSNPHLYKDAPLTVVPYTLEIGGQQYEDSINLSREEALQIIRTQTMPPTLHAPTVSDYVGIYTRLSHAYDAIISIHTSREISTSWINARKAAQQVKDFCDVAVIDSRSICGGHGMLVRVAVDAVAQHHPFDAVVKRVRGAADRVYTLYYVESLDFLQANEILSPQHTILGTMLNVKPFISFEGGKPVIIEKVKTRSQAIDHMVEFLVEFGEIDDAVILQNRSHITEQARSLQDRLSVEFPGRHFPYSVYSLPLALLVGGEATGVVVLESEMGSLSDA